MAAAEELCLFALDFTLLHYLPPICLHHATSGIKQDKQFLACSPTFPRHLPPLRGKSQPENKTSPHAWCITVVKFKPPLSQLLSNWCGYPQVPVWSPFGNIFGVKQRSCGTLLLRDVNQSVVEVLCCYYLDSRQWILDQWNCLCITGENKNSCECYDFEWILNATGPFSMLKGS